MIGKVSEQNKTSDNDHPNAGRVSSAVVGYIQRSRKKITILFTDIEDSTKYWDEHGDIQGRLMVDMHNRLTFPVVKKFRGRVIKTIGDSIMASFKRPEDAMQAAIGMQQILDQARRADSTFTLRIRIGLHTGLALVEKNDVFGDVVNVAARVESQAKGNQILVSQGTATALEDFDFGFTHAGSFKPKGKSALMTVYTTPWDDFESIVDDIKPGSYLPLVTGQKAALAFYALTCVATLGFLYTKYFRYLAADNKEIALLILNPSLVLDRYPVLLYLIASLLVGLALLLWRVQMAPHYALKTLAGGFGFCLGFLACWGAAQLPIQLLPWSTQNIYSSRHVFVDILADSVVYAAANRRSQELLRVGRGDVLLQMAVKRRPTRWTKVYLGPATYGWVAKITPAKIGKAMVEHTLAKGFVLQWTDVHSLIVGLAGFIGGYLRFRLRPV